MGHTQEEREVRNSCYGKGDRFDCYKPRIVNFEMSFEAILCVTSLDRQ